MNTYASIWMHNFINKQSALSKKNITFSDIPNVLIFLLNDTDTYTLQKYASAKEFSKHLKRNNQFN